MLSKLCLKLAAERSLCRHLYRPALQLQPLQSLLRCRQRLCSAAPLERSSKVEKAAAVEPEAAAQDALVADNLESESGEELGPCILGLFTGKINKNLLLYPELDSMAEVEAVHKLAEPVETFFAENVDSSKLDIAGELPANLLSELGTLGLFGQAAPASLGGGNLSAVSRARLAEAVSADCAIELTLRAHNSLGLAALLLAGSPEQLGRFCPDMAVGHRLAAFCLAEPGGGGGFSDPRASVRATAAPDADGAHWRLNGSKVWIANGPLAHVFVVFALTTVQIDDTEESRELLTAFLVERDQPGVSVGPPESKLGARAAATGALHLSDVLVPTGNILGEVGDGLRLARRVTASGRLAAGPAVAGSLKRLLAEATARCTAARRSGDGARRLKEFPLVQRRLARLTGLTYATESVSYLLAFLADQFPDADLTAEAAALCLLSRRASLVGAAEAAALAGGGRACAVGDYPHERSLRDAWTLAGVDSPDDLVRLQLGSRGVKHAAEDAASTVMALAAARGIMQRLRLMRTAVRVGGDADGLAVHYHHNLAAVANSIETNVDLFSRSVRYCLQYYKRDISSQQFLMSRMAECAVDLFTLLACAARASRSKSIGLRSADHELDLLVMLSKEMAFSIEHNLSGLDMNNLYTRHSDGEFSRISDYACKFGGYSVDHAISRNWD